ncbi:unnamed protein product, partial [Brassica rapa subsp. trilocularis]
WRLTYILCHNVAIVKRFLWFHLFFSLFSVQKHFVDAKTTKLNVEAREDVMEFPLFKKKRRRKIRAIY